MIDISGFRIRAEVEKLFTARSHSLIIEALRAFSSFLPITRDLGTFHHFLALGEGNSAFLWAGLCGYRVSDLGLSNKDLEFANACLENKPKYFAHTEQEYKLIALFQVAKLMADRQRDISLLAPWKTPEEKVRGLGFDGNYLLEHGHTPGPLMGQCIQHLNDKMAAAPGSTAIDVYHWALDWNVNNLPQFRKEER